MPTFPTISRHAVAILAGGQSRRMGRDKATLMREGTTLLRRTAGLAAATVGDAHVAIVGRPRPADWRQDDPTVFLPDDAPGDGPLGAVAVALRWADAIGCDRVVILACDLPLLNADALRWLLEASADPIIGDGVAVLDADGRIEPLFSVYATRIQPALAAQRAAGRRSPTALIERGDFRRVAAPAFVQKAIVDVDTPEAWRAVGGVSDVIKIDESDDPRLKSES